MAWHSPILLGLALTATFCCGQAVAQQDDAALAMVKQASQKEAAIHVRPDYFFLSEERSERTGQHLWLEAIAETPHGPLRRLLAEDGRPLDAERQKQVDAQVEELATHPAELDALNRARLADQQRGEQLLALPPDMFLYQTKGESNGVTTIAFRPNPDYKPATYQDRVLHAMAGTIEVDDATRRLRAVDAQLTEPVKFGYGILGCVQTGKIHFVRDETPHGDYKPSTLDFDMNGHILFFHTIGHAQHMVRRDFVLMGSQASLGDAEKMVMAAKPNQVAVFAH